MSDTAPRPARVSAYTADAVRAAEAPLLAEGRPLMRWAAHALAEVVAAERRDAPGPVLVLAGAGDNGGDALYAAAELAAAGGDRVDIVLVRDRVHRAALDAAVAAGATVRQTSEVCGAIDDYALVLDGILGIGRLADRRLRGSARAVVECLRARPSLPRVVAVDLPSGLDPDDGSADAAVLPADVTVTFGALKAGLVRGRGPALAGRVHLVDLGLEPYLRLAHPAVTAAIGVVRMPSPGALTEH
ncbi:yjeF N-terminal region [Microbacterium hydrothermale]|uniref:NAD(P)H-hydrate epimerase n=1 Tax=Microbacterium hydrothermale TaxID=857427 RepID=UPI001F1154FD|nr:NAD(P)H-hydrate epimerase [Microbacterium hydrothermale]MCW2164188.1 yjeF N-terminal region [Microbacterium hydrothermale]